MTDIERRRWLERAFFAAGLVAAVFYLALSAPALFARMTPVSTPQSAPSTAAAADGPVIPTAALGSPYLDGASFQDGSRIGTITIPQLKLSAPVIEGVSDADLRKGVGHVTGSAQGGGLGNVVLAAHRDTVFRPIRGIKKGMEIQLAGSQGVFRYQVDSSEIVSPNQLEVLEVGSQPEVTLITCYPFNFVGSAPLRYVVKAHLLSALPMNTP